MTGTNSPGLAKIMWVHPDTGETKEYVLTEGATVSLGRAVTNDICIPQQHVSRQHAVIHYRDGIFMLNDLNSANGTFVNDVQIEEPFPLMSGDEIRLHVPKLHFTASVSPTDTLRAIETGSLIKASTNTGGGKLIITNGPQESEEIPLMLKEVTIGRATTNFTWEIGLQDTSVSRPHAKLSLIENRWVVYDLGSSNGTTVNKVPVTDKGRQLADGDVIAFGGTIALFRSS
jgi:pSer/pThr/pTyr-binding forkhead associated (FHA) protein